MIKLRDSIDKMVLRFDKEIAQARSRKVAHHINRLKKRWLCKNDLWYLSEITNHLVWKKSDPPMTKGFVEYFHKPFCEKVSFMNWKVVVLGLFPKPEDLLDVSSVVDDVSELGKNRRLFLKFRSAYKSTVVTKLGTLQLLLNFPDIHICISHSTQVNSSDILVSIKDMFLKSRLSSLFPEYIPSTRDWGNKTGFSLANRKDYVMTGDNVEAIGVNTEVVGRKFHIFKNDDIVTDKSVTNEEQLRQSNLYLEQHKSLFINPTVVLEDYSDTRYHFADATVTLEGDPEVETDKTPLLVKDPKGDIDWQGEKYRCVLPELFTKEGIGKENVSGLMKDPSEFNLQYMLDPHNPKKVKFTEEMIQVYTHIPDGLTTYLVVDPADSEEKRACFTAMEVWGVDYDENWYWLDGLFDKIDDRERVDEAIRLAVKWRVFEVLWENLSFGRTDNRNFERASRLIPDNKRTWTVRPIGASKISKDDRILGLNDRYSRRKVFWPERLMYYSKFEGKTIDIVRKMEYEFRDFPLASHKDLLDANSFLLQIDLIKGDMVTDKNVSKYAHIKDPNVRGATERFWRDFKIMKEKECGRHNSVVEFEMV